MRPLTLILALLLAAPAWAQEPIPIFWGAKKGLVRSGLVGAWNLGTANLAKNSETPSAWNVLNGTLAGNTFTSTGSNLVVGIPLGSAVQANVEVTFCVTISASSPQSNIIFSLSTSGYETVAGTTTSYINLGTSPTKFCETKTPTAANGTQIQIGGAGTLGAGVSITVTYPQINEGSTALPYVATTDLQTVSNVVSGGAAITRGTTTGVDTNDPTLRRLGLVFDGVDDRLLSLPTKGSAWTVINCSGAHCYGVDSASGSFVDGVKTAGASEFALTTAGGYTGTLTYLMYYSRVLSPKEHAQNYFQVIKPAVNARGGTLP